MDEAPLRKEAPVPEEAAGSPAPPEAPLAPLAFEAFQALLNEWAASHVDPETGLARVECCGRLVPRDGVGLHRREIVLAVDLAEGGELVAGFLNIYSAVCPACRTEATTVPVPLATVEAHARRIVAAADAAAEALAAAESTGG